MSHSSPLKHYPTLLDTQYYPDFFIIGLTIQSISALSAVLVLVSCCKLYSKRRGLSWSFTTKAWIAITTIGIEISLFFGLPENQTISCDIQAALQQYFWLAQVLIIYLFVFRIVAIFSNNIKKTVFSLSWQSYAFVWGIPCITCAIPWAMGTFGPSADSEYDTTCWYNMRNEEFFVFASVFWFVPLYGLILYTLFLFLWIDTLPIWSNFKVPIAAVYHLRRIRMYPLVLIICQAAPTAYRLIYLINHDFIVREWMLKFAASAYSIQGLLFSCIFFTHPQVIHIWKKKICRRQKLSRVKIMTPVNNPPRRIIFDFQLPNIEEENAPPEENAVENIEDVLEGNNTPMFTRSVVAPFNILPR